MRKSTWDKLEAMQRALTSTSDATLAELCPPTFSTQTSVRCPDTACEYELTREEVQEGFSSHPNRLETTCPACGLSFITLDKVASSVTGKERCVVWLGEEQTRAAYGFVLLSDFETLARVAPHVAWNAYRYALRKGVPCVPTLEFISEVSMAFLSE